MAPWVVVTAACAEAGVDARTSEPLVVTQFDPAANFASFATFAMTDAVVLVSPFSDAGTLPAEDSQAIISEIATNLEARGYRRVSRTESPDLGVDTTAFQTLTLSTNVTPGFWTNTPGYPTTPGFWGFPSGQYASPWAYQTSAYKGGTLIVELIDLRDARGSDGGAAVPIDGGALLDASAMAVKLDTVWAAILHNYVQGVGTPIPGVLPAIDQAFVQSPYLATP
jgi:Domain of unknown function (DUF4136)